MAALYVQGFSLYESLKCFLHGFVTDVRESPDDPAEMDPFDGINLAPKLKTAAQRVRVQSLAPF